MNAAHGAKRAHSTHSGFGKHAVRSALICFLAAAPSCWAFSGPASALPSRAARVATSASTRLRGPGTFASVSMVGDGASASASEAASAAISAYSGEDEAVAVSQLGFDMVMVRSSLKLEQRIRHKTSVSSALFAAVRMMRSDMVSSLLQLGAKVEERDGKGRTPLMVAAVKGDLETMKLLLLYGASALARDANGDTALLLAARGGQVASVELLRKPAVSLHHLYSPPHFKGFLWMSGGGGAAGEGGPTAEAVSEAALRHKAVPLCKMNLDMVSINAALRLDTLLDGGSGGGSRAPAAKGAAAVRP